MGGNLTPIGASANVVAYSLMEIAERVRIARQRKRLTQSDLARLLHCSRKRVNDVERGLSTLSPCQVRRNFTLKNVCRLVY
jgi:DNA-binding XRE family transcriptional regulator